MAFRRSPHDREIVRLAVPALGALAAEPLYLLADTAIVGQLGTRPLAGLAVAGTVLTAAFGVFNFLAYATTAKVARQVGAGDRRRAAQHGIDGLWLALALGLVLLVVGVTLAPQIVDAMGASSRVRPFAISYLRISMIGAPALLLSLAAAGYLRGLQDTRTTLVIAVSSNVVNLLLEILFVFGFDWGIEGSAWGTVTAQLAAACAYAFIVRRSARAHDLSLRPDLAGMRAALVVGGPLVVRTASLLVTFIVTTNLAARIGDDDVAAHQIAFQIFLFLALSVDALAIAGQAMIGRFLGAADAVRAREVARRLMELGILIGIALAILVATTATWLVRGFSDSTDIRDLAIQLLLVVAVLQPLNAVVFVLDGVLIGAGDQRYLALAMIVATFGVFVPLAVLVSAVDGGVVALWGALAGWFAARAVALVARYSGPRWQVIGADRQ
ncbi:MAG: MATE family efflux transporter [Actinobacteria bacterium]|nr:MATE family efflux transporter [Actinomycetota bacterium]